MKKYCIKSLSFMLALAVIVTLFAPSVFASSSTTATTSTTAASGPKDISFEMETDKDSVRTKEIVRLTVTMRNNSSKDVNELEFSLDFDTKRILGFTTDYSASLNGVTSPNDNSPVVLRQQGSTVRIYNYDPSNANSTRAPLKAGSTLSITFPMVVSETASNGAASFILSGCKANDTSGNALSVGGYPQCSVTVSPTSSNANLSELIVSVNDAPVSISPAFSPDVTQYSVTVGNSIPSIKFNVQCSDERATFTTDKPSQLQVGSNSFKFTVTAEDKTTTKIYTVNVKRLAPGETTVSTSTTTTTTTSTTATTTTTTVMTEPTETTTTTFLLPEINDITEPSGGGPDGQLYPSEPADTDRKEGTTITLNLAALLGIVASEIALFLLAFSAGYVTHKNAAQPQKYSVDELMEAQEKLDMQNRLASAAQTPQPVPAPAYQPYTSPAVNYPAGYLDPSQTPFTTTTFPDMTAGYPGTFSGATDFTPPMPDMGAMPGAPTEMPADGAGFGQSDVYYQ